MGINTKYGFIVQMNPGIYFWKFLLDIHMNWLLLQ